MADPTVVHEASGLWTSGTTYPVTITAPTNTNWLYLIHSSNNSTTVSSISGGGGTWQKLVGILSSATDLEIWACPNVSAGGTTVTVTMSGTPTAGVGGKVIEFNNMPPTLTLDGTASTPITTSASPDTGTATTTNPKNLIVGATLFINAAAISHTAGPTNGFTGMTDFVLRAVTPFIQIWSAYLVSSAAGSQSTGWTANVSGNWIGAIAAVIIELPTPSYPYIGGGYYPA